MVRTAGWVGAKEALARLGVRPQTLYSYVSRGRLKARPDPTDPRRSLYSEPDVERLAQRRRVGRQQDEAATSTLRGELVFLSAISTIHAGQLIYRGVDAIDLAETATLEETAGLLWKASPDIFARAKETEQLTPPEPNTSALALLAQLAEDADPAQGRAAWSLHLDAAAVLAGLVQAISGVTGRTDEPFHAQLARGWKSVEAANTLRRALVLLADHEFTPPTFAARITASTGASIAACALSGLTTLAGSPRGYAGVAVDRFVREAEADGAHAALRSRLAQGLPIPGFGHTAYAGADPRSPALLESFEIPAQHAELCLVGKEILGLSPNVDFALSALAARFGLTPNAPFLILATARCVGWMAHALEQGSEGGTIKTHMRYIGPLPRRQAWARS
ncbi:MAG: citrate/2-methylcitrate synthase [Caulobacteraceae bacterium]